MVEEIVAVMRKIPVDRHGLRLRAMIVVLWRGGLRIQEALDLTESDLDARRGSILVRLVTATSAARSGWTLGPGAITSRRGSRVVRSCRSGRCSACSTERLAGGPGRPLQSARSCAATRLRPGSGAALRPISSGMLTLSSSPAKACRYQ